MPARSLNSTARFAAVAIAAVSLGVVGCSPRAIPVPVTIDQAAPLPRDEEPDPDDEPPKTVVRDWNNAPSSALVAWEEEEWWQGLRAQVDHRGHVIREHVVFLGTDAFPNFAPYHGAVWHAWVDGVRMPEPLVTMPLARDIYNCQHVKNCTPREFFSAWISDRQLRATRDSLVINVFPRLGPFETRFVLRRPLIRAYLAAVDSMAAARSRQLAIE